MTGTVAHIFRHPIKAHGREALASVLLSAGECLPWDRRWAVAQEAAKLVPGWNSCVLFSRGAKSPQLMAITCALDEASGRVVLDHPQAGRLSFRPDDPADLPAFLAWAAPLVAEGRMAPVGIARHDGGMTDNPVPTVSILSLASLQDLSRRMGMDLSIHRWRANFWIEGAEPWAELAWVGRRISLGRAELEVTERIGRCKATGVNPETGLPEGDTLAALEDNFAHTDFGVFAKVVTDGRVSIGDAWSLT
jgi:uncharacterized protein YcbX